jgi:hypothetical protein
MATNPNDSVCSGAGSADQGYATQHGLTKREHFAALAMQGMIGATPPDDTPASPAQITAAIAQASVMMADALIAALNKEPVR